MKPTQDAPRPSLSTKEIAPEGQRAGAKRLRQKIEIEGEGEGHKGKRAGVFVPEGQRTASGWRGDRCGP